MTKFQLEKWMLLYFQFNFITQRDNSSNGHSKIISPATVFNLSHSASFPRLLCATVLWNHTTQSAHIIPGNKTINYSSVYNSASTKHHNIYIRQLGNSLNFHQLLGNAQNARDVYNYTTTIWCKASPSNSSYERGQKRPHLSPYPSHGCSLSLCLFITDSVQFP